MIASDQQQKAPSDSDLEEHDQPSMEGRELSDTRERGTTSFRMHDNYESCAG
jgi:hypothetical protein